MVVIPDSAHPPANAEPLAAEPSEPTDPSEALDAVDASLRALAPFLSESQAAEARAFVLDALAAHPLGRQLVSRVRARAEPDRSGEVGLSDGSEAFAASPAPAASPAADGVAPAKTGSHDG